MCIIRTGRVMQQYQDGLDITVKSGKGILAPTWDIVMGYKKGEITEGEYTDRYLAILRHNYRRHPKAFLDILKRESVTLQCYCRPGQFCHRHIAVYVLLQIARVNGIEARFGGEIGFTAKFQQYALQLQSIDERTAHATLMARKTLTQSGKHINTDIGEPLWQIGTPNTGTTDPWQRHLHSDRWAVEQEWADYFDTEDQEDDSLAQLVSDMPRITNHRTHNLKEVRQVQHHDENGEPMFIKQGVTEHGVYYEKTVPYMGTALVGGGVVINQRPTGKKWLPAWMTR